MGFRDRFLPLVVRLFLIVILAGVALYLLNPPRPSSRSDLIDDFAVVTLQKLALETPSPTVIVEDAEKDPLQWTPTLTPFQTDNGGQKQTNTPSQTASLIVTTAKTATNTQSVTLTSLPSATITPSPSPSPSQSVTQSQTPTPTEEPTNTPTPQIAAILGKLLLDETPISLNVRLILEDQSLSPVLETNTESEGNFVFQDVPASIEGYNILFAQESNPDTDVYQVMNWGWLGPIPVQAGEQITLPDFDIGLQGLVYTDPTPDSQVPVSSISPAFPLEFRWTGHPYAEKYWISLLEGNNLSEVWQSGFTTENSFEFNGILSDGSSIQPGQYWWGVGAQGKLGEYTVTIFGFLEGFRVIP